MRRCSKGCPGCRFSDPIREGGSFPTRISAGSPLGVRQTTERREVIPPSRVTTQPER